MKKKSLQKYCQFTVTQKFIFVTVWCFESFSRNHLKILLKCNLFKIISKHFVIVRYILPPYMTTLSTSMKMRFFPMLYFMMHRTITKCAFSHHSSDQCSKNSIQFQGHYHLGIIIGSCVVFVTQQEHIRSIQCTFVFYLTTARWFLSSCFVSHIMPRIIYNINGITIEVNAYYTHKSSLFMHSWACSSAMCNWRVHCCLIYISLPKLMI